MATSTGTQTPSKTLSTGSAPSVSDLAANTKADRNRAVDFYRAVAMLAVAFGHWLALVAIQDADGELIGGNALSFVPELGWMSAGLDRFPGRTCGSARSP